MSAFGQWSLDDILYRMSFDQLVYWHKLALYKNYKIDPVEELNKNLEVNEHGNKKFTQDDFDSKYKYDEKSGWVRK
jgi:hypothetical protein